MHGWGATFGDGHSARPPVNIEEFLAELAEHRTPEEVRAAEKIIEWARAARLKDEFGARNSKGVPYWPRIRHLEGRGSGPLQVFTKARSSVVVLYKDLLTRRPFNAEGPAADLRRRIEALPGVDPKPHWPSVPLSALAEPRALDEFLGLMGWVIDRIKRVNL
jgi:hypothetical protein